MRIMVLLVAAAMLSCEGSYGGPCYPNSTCNQGYKCEKGTCVEPARGTEMGECYPNRTCNKGLVCNDQGYCEKAAMKAKKARWKFW
jgi:hypothetical protein